MSRKIFTLAVLLLAQYSIYAQSVANYTVARSTGITYNSIAGTGNSVSFWRNNIANQNDDNRSNPINIGFDFWYMGVRYTTVSIGLNGFIDFSGAIYDGNAGGGAGVVNCGGVIAYRQSPVAFSTSGCAATPPTTYSGTYIALAAMYTDLWVSGGVAALANSIKYQTTGSAPNRVFTAEYVNFDDFSAGVASFNFQVKIYETTGRIEYVYGSMTGAAGATTTTNYALGINGSTMSAVPTAAQLLVQQNDNTATFSNAIKNNLTTFPVTNTQISFVPVAPANPGSVLTFTGVTNTDMTLNWTDWAANEQGYVIYSSTDGVNYTFARQVAANTITATFNSLFGSLYFWKVYAVTEGALSTALTGSQATLPGAVFVSAQTGPWNTGATWVGGFVPTPGDNATITAGHVVTVNGNNSITDITVNGTLQIGDNATPRTFTLLGNMTISATGTFSSGSVATHSVIYQGNVTNNGVFNMSPGGGSITNVTFNKNGNQTFSGTGATTNFNNIILNMGTASTNIADFTCSSFSAPTDFLTLQNGTFKFSVPTAAVTLNLYSAGTTILNSTGIFMNSPNSTMNFLSTMNFQGDLTVNTGMVRVGDAADENLVSNGSDIIINGGTVEVAGRLTRPSYISITNFTMNGGTMILNTFGSNDAAPPAGTSAAGPFTIDVVGSKFIMTGGTIIIRQSGAGGTGNLGYTNTGVTNYTFSGGTIQIGDALTPAANSMKINTDQSIYNLYINTTNGPTALLTSAMTVANTITINAGATLNAQNFNVTEGGSFVNDGTYTPGTNTTFFNGTSPIFGATITTFNNINLTGSLSGHVVNMNVNGNWTNNGGTFSPGTGTVTFTGTGAQAINGTAASQTFNHITINKTAGQTLSMGGSTTTLTIGGNYIQTQGNFLPVALGTVNVGGDWTHTAGTFTPSTSTVNFNGTGAQLITSAALVSETFYRLSINKTPGTLLTTGGAVVTLTATNNFAQTTGDFTPPVAFFVGGNWTHDAGAFTPGTGTVTFNGTAAQQISSAALATETFYNLTINKTAGTLLNTGGTITTIIVGNNYLNTQGNFTPPASLYITGNLTITAGIVTAGTLIDLQGNWAHNGGTFTAGTSTVSFTGTGAQQISNVATETFYNMTVNKTVGTLLNTAANPTTITIQNNFTQTQGNFTPPATLNVGGNFTHDTGTFTPGAGTVVFNGAGPQLISSANFLTETFNNMTVNKTAGTLLTVGGTVTTLALNGNYVNTQGNFTAPATLTIAGNTTLTAGTLTAGTLIDAKGNWTNNGGTFTPLTSTVTFTGAAGQAINGTAPSQTFNNVTINKPVGQTLTSGGSTATLNIQGNYTQTQGNFTPIANGVTNVGGNWIHDAGTFTPNTGTVNFNGTGAQQISSATLATETFYRMSVTKTPGTLLNTGGVISAITVTNNYTQTTGDFTPPLTMNVAGNWTHDAGTFTPGTGTVVFNGGGAQLLTSAALATETFYNLTVNKGGGTLTTGGTVTTMSVGNNYTNTAGGFTAPATLTVAGNITVTAGTFTGGTLVDLKGNWIHNGGAFTPATSTVVFTGTGAQQITNLVTETFYNLTVNKTVATLLNTGANPTTITVQNNYTQTSGDFTPPATLNIGGNFSHNAGTFTPGTGTVVFNGTGAQQISSSAFATETFYNMTVNKTAGTLLNTAGLTTTIALNNNFVNTQGNFNAPATFTVAVNFTTTNGTVTGGTAIDVNGNVALNGGTLVAPITMNVAGGWSKAAATVFTPGTGTVIFDGAGAQVINGTTVTQVFNNFVVNKTAATVLSTGGSTVAITTQDYTHTQGTFTAPATLNVNGNVTLTAGILTAGANTNVAGNWVRNGGTFTPGANTVTFNGTSQQNVNGSLPTNFGRLTINNSFGTSPQILFGITNTVVTQLTMTLGVIQTSAANLLILANAATANIGSTTSYIDGPLQYDMAVANTTRTLNMPIGKGAYWGGVSLTTRHSLATSYSYTAEVIHSSAMALGYTLAPTTDLVSLVRYWDIKRGLTASPLTTDNTNLVSTVGNPLLLTVNYIAVDGVNQPANLTLVKTIGAATAWNDIGGTAAGFPAGSIAMAAFSANFTSFSLFTLGNKTGGTNPLPIELLDFSARRIVNEIALNWITASELNNDQFEIQRQSVGGEFEKIGSVKGAGNSTMRLSYSFMDSHPLMGNNYYRLKQIDFDGKSSYSSIKLVNFELVNDGLGVMVFPNPSGPEEFGLTLTRSGGSDELIGLQILDLTGRVVAAEEFRMTGLQFTTKWKPGLPLAPGMYLIKMISGSEQTTTRLVVK